MLAENLGTGDRLTFTNRNGEVIVDAVVEETYHTESGIKVFTTEGSATFSYGDKVIAQRIVEY